MKLLFLNGERGLFATRPYDVICFPDKGSNITKPGLYECEIVKQKEKFAFVDGVPVKTRKADISEVVDISYIMNTTVRCSRDYLYIPRQNLPLGRKIGDSYIYMDSMDMKLFYYTEGENKVGISHDIYEIDSTFAPKKNYRASINDAFSDKSSYENILPIEDLMWYSIKDSLVNIDDDLFNYAAATALGESYDFIGLKASLSYELSNVMVTRCGKNLIEVSFNARNTSIYTEGIVKNYFIILRSLNKSEFCFLQIKDQSMINSIQKNLPDTVIDKKILTLDEVHDFMRKNMIGNLSTRTTDDFKESDFFDTGYGVLEYAIVHTNLDIFKNKYDIPAFDAFSLLILILHYKYGDPDALNEFMKNFRDVRDKSLGYLNTIRKRIGKNASSKNMVEIKKLSYDAILNLNI